ncbi:MAG TPA: S26 family signal peptidase [Thermoplasmata archaeon]|nr:S26 family signal peptidase [Thermoplasmata archaeon]
MPRDEPEEDEAPQNVWIGLARDLIVAGVIVAVFLASIYAYAGTWPPLVVVESSSMQHSDRESFLGVIDTGDMVFQQAAPTRASIVTYIEGRAGGYSTYGDYGDVIIFNRPGNPTPVIHRAIMYATVHPNGTADVLDLANPALTNWSATNGAGATTDPHFLETLTIRAMGFDHDLGITFNFPRDFMRFAPTAPRSGYITMGDHNAYLSCSLMKDPCRASLPYDTGWMPRQSDVVGRARGELPWFGLLKLTLQPTDSCCPGGWGDPEAPNNSWNALLVSLLFLLALPFILEIAGRGWTKYVRPRLPRIRWPWRRWSR